MPGLDAKISQADLSAYAVLYVHGGVYADMDTWLGSWAAVTGSPTHSAVLLLWLDAAGRRLNGHLQHDTPGNRHIMK